MSGQQGVFRMRLERLADRRDQLRTEIARSISSIEADNRMVSPDEEQRLNRRRDELKELDMELERSGEELARIDAAQVQADAVLDVVDR